MIDDIIVIKMLLCHNTANHQSGKYILIATNSRTLIANTAILLSDSSVNSIANQYHYGEEHIETQVYPGFFM